MFERGLGIPLMRELTDEIEFRREGGGTTVRLLLTVAPAHDERRVGRGDPEAGRAAGVARRHRGSVRDAAPLVRRARAAVSIDLADIDSAVIELGDPEMIAALAMRKLQALRLLATPGVRTTTDVVVAIVNDLDRALLQAPDLAAAPPGGRDRLGRRARTAQ